jgi:hypothetical protein
VIHNSGERVVGRYLPSAAELGTLGVFYSDTYACHFMLCGGGIMKCPKCNGRMFSEKFYDFVRSFDAWKCSCCGEVLDPTIVTNRARNQNLFLG